MENKESKLGIYDDCFNEVIFDAVSKNSNCLDIGCWTGNLGKFLIGKKSCVVEGVDFNQEVLLEAERIGYSKTYVCNFNNAEFELNIENKYDYIICEDVLEHLSNPEAVLKRLKKLLKDDGRVLISIPNIGFIQQRVNHLFGNFSYNPAGGIMDETHLRFFTFKTIKELCLKSGYQIAESYGYAQVKDRFFFLRPLAKIWPSLFALQLFLSLKKNEK